MTVLFSLLHITVLGQVLSLGLLKLNFLQRLSVIGHAVLDVVSMGQHSPAQAGFERYTGLAIILFGGGRTFVGYLCFLSAKIQGA